MSQADNPTSLELQAQVLHLHQELQMRDQLVEQLSEELFRLIQDKPGLTQAYPQTTQSLQRQFQAVKQQLALHREDIAQRNAEIAQLRQSVQDLNTRNSLLEQAIQELPEAYRQRFAERIRPVRQKLVMLQQENRQLHTRLQNVSYRLAIRTRYPKQVELPNFSRPADCSHQNNFRHPSTSAVERISEDG